MYGKRVGKRQSMEILNKKTRAKRKKIAVSVFTWSSSGVTAATHTNPRTTAICH
jgi:hypothetical protein